MPPIESVLIPDGERLTLCVSTQVGCAMGCGFCATATLGLGRHLRRGEIVGQLLVARTLVAAEEATHAGPERISNMVFMGMGEPLHNYAGTVGAIETLTADWGVDFSHRRITVSTVGLLPEMRRLLADTQVNLAVSLTAIDQDVRRRIMPVSKKYPVEDLLATCRTLPLPRRKRITFEYVMLAGVNDAPVQARAARARAQRHSLQGQPDPVQSVPGRRVRPQRRRHGGALPGRAPQRRRPRDRAREPRARHRRGVRAAGRRGRRARRTER